MVRFVIGINITTRQYICSLALSDYHFSSYLAKFKYVFLAQSHFLTILVDVLRFVTPAALSTIRQPPLSQVIASSGGRNALGYTHIHSWPKVRNQLNLYFMQNIVIQQYRFLFHIMYFK